MKEMLVMLFLSLSMVQGSLAAGPDGFGEHNPESKYISIVQLLANSDKWHNKSIHIEGVLIYEFEGNALYLSLDDARNRVTKNAAWLNINNRVLGVPNDEPESIGEYKKVTSKIMLLKEWSGEYVYVQGIYNKDINGHMGMFSGSMEVTRIYPKQKR